MDTKILSLINNGKIKLQPKISTEPGTGQALLIATLTDILSDNNILI